jgi:hypothetical protein
MRWACARKEKKKEKFQGHISVGGKTTYVYSDIRHIEISR